MLGHPQIAPPRGRRKELQFFNRFRAREMREEDIAAYHELFPRQQGQIAGEWTPRYMRDFWVPRLLRRAAPEARLLVLLRDPVERFRSGTVHSTRRHTSRTPEEATTDAIERGRYASQLKRLRDFFPDEQILVMQYERCREDPVGEFRRTLRFLGVDQDRKPPDFERPRGKSTEPDKVGLWPDLTEALQTALEAEVREVATLVPDLDLGLWPNFAHLAEGGAAQAAKPARRVAAPSARPERGRAPSYIGVGMPGAGAVWWQRRLMEHPDVDGPAGEPSLHFFNQFCTREMTDEDIAAYHVRFASVAGRGSGEWTPRYAVDAWTPPLLRRAAPDARLLVMLSDPIERYRKHLASVGVGNGTHPSLDPAGPGRYALLLQRLREHFEAERILVLQTERCVAEPAGEYARTLRFLGLDDGFRPRWLERRAARGLTAPDPSGRPWWRRAVRRVRQGGQPRKLWPEIEDALHAVLDDEVAALAAMVPELDLSLWPNFAHLAEPARTPEPAQPSLT